jgi:hypothetical protein
MRVHGTDDRSDHHLIANTDERDLADHVRPLDYLREFTSMRVTPGLDFRWTLAAIWLYDQFQAVYSYQLF